MKILKNFSKIRSASGHLARSVTFGAFLTTLVGCTTMDAVNNAQPVASQPTSVAAAAETDPDSAELPQGMLSWNGERTVSQAQGKFTFDWPVDDARMTRGFFYGRRAHWGLDLANRKGTPIVSSERGMVVYTGRAFRGYGKLIVIEHNNQWATLYAHLDTISVKEGQIVEQGQKIGLMGRTGRASGVHLHFEIRQNRMPVNPLAYLPETPASSPGRVSDAGRFVPARSRSTKSARR